MAKRRNFTDQFKAKVALEALRGDKTVQEIAAKHQSHPNQVSTWNRHAIDGMADVFSGGKQAGPTEAEIKELHAKIGRLAMMKEIDRVFTKYPFFGSRQIAAYLLRESTGVGRHRVRRLMAKMGLEAIYKRPRTSQPHPQHPVYPYLLRKMQIDRPNQVLLSAM